MNDFPLLKNYWFIACQSKQLRQKPLKRTILATPLVLFRANGKPAALLDRCPHRNAPLSEGWVTDGRIACPYHGWQFDERGVCRAVPGLCGEASHRTRQAQAYPVVEQEGFVWVFGKPAEASTSPPCFAYLNEKGYTSFRYESTASASLLNALENFLDGTHTHFVHRGLIRTEGYRKETRAIIRRKGDRVEAEYLDEGQQSGLISQLFGAGIDFVFGRFILPSLAQLEYRAQGQTKLLITLSFTPESEHFQRVFAVVSGQAPPYLGKIAAAAIKPFFWLAFQQDRQIMRQQTANIERFGHQKYVSTELDVLRPHILRLLKHGPLPEDQIYAEKEVRMMM